MEGHIRQEGLVRLASIVKNAPEGFSRLFSASWSWWESVADLEPEVKVMDILYSGVFGELNPKPHGC